MKKTHKFSIAALAVLMCAGGAVALASHAKGVTKVEAAQTLPDINAGVSYKYHWSSGSNPVDGNQTLSVGTSSSSSVTYNVGKTTSNEPYIQITENSTSNFVADVLPIYFSETLSSYFYSERTYTFEISITGSGSSVKSLEFFHYTNASDTTSTNPSQYASYWFYANDTTTTNTGLALSVRRIATTNTTVTATVTASTKADNFTAGNRNAYFHFGMYAYKSTGSGSFTAKVTMKSYTGGTQRGTLAVDNVFYSSQTAAVSAYNSKNESVMKLYDSYGLSGNLLLQSHNGRLELNSKTLLCYGYSIYVREETTIKGYGIITGSAETMFIMDTNNVELYLTGNVNITCSGATRAMWIASTATESAIHLTSQDTIATSNTSAVPVWMDAGKLYCAGRIQAANSTLNAISCGSNDTRKTVYIYGSEANILGYVRLYSLSYCFLRGSFNNTPYSGTSTIRVKIDGACQLGDTVVYDVNDDNASKFILVRQYYTLERSDANLVLGYAMYTVSYDLTNIMKATTTDTVSHFDVFRCTLTADSGYKLPGSISVTEVSGGSSVAHTYNSTTGMVYIAAEVIKANIRITAAAVKQYTVQFKNLDGSTAQDPRTVSNGTNITLGSPSDSAIPAYHHFLCWRTTTDGTGAAYNENNQYRITGDTVFYAYYAQTDAEVVDQFVGIQLHFDVDVISTDDNRDTGNCRGENGYYALAKAVYLTFTSSQKTLFRTGDYENARARFSAWAAANGETYNPSTGAISSSVYNNGDNLNAHSGNNMVLIISVITAISVASLLVLIVLKKRHHK